MKSQARTYGLNWPRRRLVAFANAEKSAASSWVAFAHAHAVLARSYGLNTPRRCSATLANAKNNAASSKSGASRIREFLPSS